MVAVPRDHHLSLEEYLERERDAEEKSEYFDGMLIATAGASPAHNTITFNLAGELGPQLRGGPCRGLASDQRVRIASGNRYLYPDIVVVCGEPRYELVNGLRSLLNPTLVIEVLSESTERLDRGDKFDAYRALDSVEGILFVAQDRPRLERYSRQAGGSWQYDAALGPGGAMPLETVASTLMLAHVYENVEFPPPASVVRTDTAAP